MSSYSINLNWQRETPDFDYKTFNRGHVWQLSGDQTVRGSAAPDYFGDADRSNPEEALLAALSSCHMLTFLAIAALKKLVVDRYEDEPVAEVGKNVHGKMMVSQITLRPKVTFSGAAPDSKVVMDLHRKATENCFIGNSLLTPVALEPRF